MNYVSESITHLIADDPDHPVVFDGEIYDKVSVTVGLVGSSMGGSRSADRADRFSSIHSIN